MNDPVILIADNAPYRPARQRWKDVDRIFFRAGCSPAATDIVKGGFAGDDDRPGILALTMDAQLIPVLRIDSCNCRTFYRFGEEGGHMLECIIVRKHEEDEIGDIRG